MESWLIGIFIFLLAYSAATIFVVKKQTKSLRPQQVVSLYMLLKGAKLLLFLLAVFIYVFTVKIEVKPFVLIAIGIYFIFLLFDTWYLTSVEKKLKKNV
ncbi:hypothetical protein FACS1894162_5300 [Bacteroidia bacterium]|nr:hypothetical protein FACS1894162_5300 [Bacteroidia bacterium]